MNDDFKWFALGSAVGMLILVLLVGSVATRDARYYECVYTLKGVAYTPADIQVLCKK